MKTSTRNPQSEIELRVSQELKNNQDFIYQTNQSLQSLNNNIVALSLRLEKSQSENGSNMKSLEIEFENMKELVIGKLNNFAGRVGDLESGFLAMKHYMDKSFIMFADDYLSTDDHDTHVEYQNSRIGSLESQIKIDNDYYDSVLNSVTNYTKSELKSLADKIPVIPDLDPMKKEISDKLDSFTVDCKGIMKELSIVKKSLAYDEKKFENIYTLIERLKADKS